jgi:ADP-heptose:LPS heptosyltransferase
MKQTKILIFKLGLLGDVLMTTPFVRNLRHIFPQAEIHYYVGKSYRVALEGNPHLSTLVDFDEQMFYRRDFRQVSRLWRRIKREQFDLVFLLGKHWFFNAFAASLGIPTRVGFAREPISRIFLTRAVPFLELRHEIYYYLDLLQFVGSPDYSDLAMEVEIGQKDEARAESLIEEFKLRGFVATINSGGNNAGENQFVRRLPAGFFQNLVMALARRGPVVLLGNAADRKHYAQFPFPANVVDMSGQLSFRESLALMRRAKRIFTTDCGGMHMAATVTEHITAFFGPAHPLRKLPLRADVEVVWPDRARYNPYYDLYNTGLREPSFQDIIYSLNGQTIDSPRRSAVPANS